MTFPDNHILDVVFKDCATDKGEPGVKMVIYTDIDPSPTTDEGKRVLADLMGEVEAHARRHPEIRRIKLLKEPPMG